MNHIFIEKMLLAKKYEEEALLSLLPVSVQGHMKVIRREMTAIAGELTLAAAERLAGELSGSAGRQFQSASEKDTGENSKSVKKIHLE